MDKFKNYFTPKLIIISMPESDVVCASGQAQVDVYTADAYDDGWKDGSFGE